MKVVETIKQGNTMSNQVFIEPTQFVDVRSGAVSYGFRAYDDCGKSYCNLWDSIPDDDLEFLKKVMAEEDTVTNDLLDFVNEMGKGLNIGDTYYEWDEIRHLWGEDGINTREEEFAVIEEKDHKNGLYGDET
jgi:hypothetical protein